MTHQPAPHPGAGRIPSKRRAMSPRILRPRVLVALIPALASPLHGQRAPVLTRTDSAGISIATNTGPASGLQPVFTVAAEPRVRIGAVDGASEVLFAEI